MARHQLRPPRSRPAGAVEKNLRKTSQAIRSGIQPRTLYHLRDTGAIEAITRGVYRLARLPKAVICLTSALALHEVHIALPRGTEQPRLEHPPLRVVRLRPACFGVGIEERRVDGVDLRLYSAAKTVVDCFKFRNQVGLDTALSALKALRGRRGFDVEQLLGFASLCRVERILRPYLEAIL